MWPYLGLFRRELLLAVRQGGEIGLALGFFILAVVLFPLGVGPEAEMLRRIGAGIIWVAALLAAVAAALTLGARRPGVLSSLIVLPLYLPVLIFGAGAVEAGVAGTGARA